MDERAAIQHALTRAGISAAIQSLRDLYGGCIHRVIEVQLSDRSRVVAKINHAATLPQFEEEAHSLQALAATGTVLVPKPLAATSHAGAAILLMSAMTPAAGRPGVATWRQFATELAALHQRESGTRYGYDQDNHIGSTAQINSWHDDWVEFNAVNRLGYQTALARDNNVLDAREAQVMESLIARLDRLIPRHPKPALL